MILYYPVFFKQPRLSQVKQRSGSSCKQQRHRQRCCAFALYRNIERIEIIEGIEQWAFETKNIEVSLYHVCPLGIGIELSQVSRYFDISNIELVPAQLNTTLLRH